MVEIKLRIGEIYEPEDYKFDDGKEIRVYPFSTPDIKNGKYYGMVFRPTKQIPKDSKYAKGTLICSDGKLKITNWEFI